jgi:hypothetical protein
MTLPILDSSSDNPLQPVIDFFNSTKFRAGLELLGFFIVVLWLSTVFYAYKDARRRIADPVLVAVAVATALVFPFVGCLIYMVLRPPEYLDDVRERELEIRAMERRLGSDQRCPYCRTDIEPSFLSCPVCANRLKAACRRCKAPLETHWQLCPYCETPVREEAADLTVVEQPTRRRTRQSPRPRQ